MDDRFVIDDDPPKSQTGLWIVAAGLVTLLVGYHTFGSSEPDDPATPRPTPVGLQVQNESAPQRAEPKPVDWPEIAFDDLISNNPFNPRAALERTIHGTSEDQADVQFVENKLNQEREERRKQKDQMARELAADQWKVRMLLDGPHGTAALIGDRIVNQGDEVDGYQIIAIEADGVLLRPVPQDE